MSQAGRLEAAILRAKEESNILRPGALAKEWDPGDVDAIEVYTICRMSNDEWAQTICWTSWAMSDDQFSYPTEIMMLLAFHMYDIKCNDSIFRNSFREQGGDLNRAVADLKCQMDEQVKVRLQRPNNPDPLEEETIFIIGKSLGKLDKEGNVQYNLIENPKLLQAYMAMLCMCSFRTVTKPASTLVRNLRSTYIKRFKGFYPSLPKEGDEYYSIPNEGFYENIRPEVQEGSRAIRNIIKRCLLLCEERNTPSSTRGLLEYSIFVHTQMAGLQLISMIILVSDALAFYDVYDAMLAVSFNSTLPSIRLMFRFVQRYLEIHDDIPVSRRDWFRWAKLFDPLYFADLSLKKNLILGFLLACFSSNRRDEGQCAMAVFADPRLTDVTKKCLFKRAHRIKVARASAATDEPCTQLAGEIYRAGLQMVKNRRIQRQSDGLDIDSAEESLDDERLIDPPDELRNDQVAHAAPAQARRQPSQQTSSRTETKLDTKTSDNISIFHKQSLSKDSIHSETSSIEGIDDLE